MLAGVLNFVSMVLLIYDTVGYIANYSKKKIKTMLNKIMVDYYIHGFSIFL